jgi:hypothetical protein
VGFQEAKAALGQIFAEHFDFSCQLLIPPIAPQSSSIIEG